MFGFCFRHVWPRTKTHIWYKTEIGNDISRRNESKTIWGPTATSPPEKSKGVLSHKKMIVPQNIFLTLTNDYYRENLFDFFRKLGATNESQRDSEEEKRVKEEAYNFFKTSGGKLVKHINWKKPEMGYYEVDDESARTSEWILSCFNTFFTRCQSPCLSDAFSCPTLRQKSLMT